jgi:YD repeat-containing protein
MHRTKYLCLIGASIALATGLFLWNRKPTLTSVKTVTDERQMAHYYTLMTERLFNIQLDGALRLLYRLNDDPEMRAAGFDCMLMHVVEITPRRTALSQWTLPFTESYLVPYDFGDLQWRQPNGTTILFKNGRIAQKSAIRGGDGWELKKIGPAAYNVFNSVGDSFSYENGCLSGITTQSGRHYRVKTRGGLITNVAEMGQPNSEPTLFSAQFDDFGHCTEVRFAGHPTEEFDWDDRGFLKEWKDGSGRQVNFSYNDGLLDRVTEPQKADLPIIWAENKEFINRDTEFGSPVKVKSAGTRNYLFSYSTAGVLIATTCADEKQNSTTLYNLWTHTIIQKTGDQTIRLYFDRIGGEGTLRAQRVEVTDPAEQRLVAPL